MSVDRGTDPAGGGGQLVRRRHAATSPLEPDWLVQRFIVRDVRAALAGVSGRILDVGCGGRPYESLVEPGSRYFGLDAQPTASSRPDAWGSAARLPIAEGSVDAVLCTQVLEHVPDPEAVVREIARVLRPGGRLILTAPQTWCLHEAPHDYFRFTRYGLESICRAAGLSADVIRPQGGFGSGLGISVVMLLGNAARRLLGRAAASAPTPAVSPRTPPADWRRALWPLRAPMALVNLFFALLDALPQQGEFAVNHLVVATRGHATGESHRP